MAHVTSRFSSGRSIELIASGVPTLDLVLGGGFPLGSIVLISEDELGVYSDLFFKVFLSQGIVNHNTVFLASPEGSAESFFKFLPALMDSHPGDQTEETMSNEPMTIAWRYGNSTSFREPIKQLSLSDNFTFGKHMPTESLSKDIIVFKMEDSGEGHHIFNGLLKQIKALAAEHLSRSQKSAQKSHLRIGIHHIGSALWKSSQSEIPAFLFKLRCVISQYPASVVVTLPPSVFKDPKIVSRCQQISDIVLRLVAIDPTSNPLYSEYNGLLQLCKISPVNSLTPLAELTDDWAFKLSKKRLLVERLTLPPELDTSTQREQVKDLPKCGSKILDF